MKPEVSSPDFNVEQPRFNERLYPNIEKGVSSPEVGKTPEVDGKKAEAASAAVETVLATTLPAPAVTITKDDADTGVSITTPLTAKDDDLMEKEWVDRAKQIVSETRDNPHQREKAVNKLQIEYLKKRYGRELSMDGN
jgi:hypothetical protein